MGDKSVSVSTTWDARLVIEEIARRKGSFTDAFKREAEEEARKGRKGMLQAIEGSEEIREDLAKALKIISTDLYTSRARFLMEVIQNADDNNYAEGETPTVSITVRPGRVEIGCNEEGFSRENIQALCRTGRSSKKPGQGYTGEKGIGFKSVFKLANRAHIKSPPYHFQLDQTRELGMITPHWDENFFNEYKAEYQTSIILDNICDQSTDFSKALESDIRAIDPVLLLFLRRIERLHLHLYRLSSEYGPEIQTRFQRVNWTPDSGFVSLKEEDVGSMRYMYKHRFTIDFNGTEQRRPGIKKTDIILIFPVKKEIFGNYSPLIQRQNLTYAYLPLGDFGFKFVIQADFLTTSNRQSVDEDNYWNKNIAGAIPLALEAAIYNFNYSEKKLDFAYLSTSWPVYLNLKFHSPSSYWWRIKQNIINHLSSSPVIKDRSGGYRKPKDLFFLDQAHDRKGEPIFGQMCDYVSSEYSKSVHEALLLLGVKIPSWKWVCDKLQELHDTNQLRTKMLNEEWCSDLARVLLETEEPNGEKKFRKNLKKIAIIPMADGTWRRPPSKDEPIYFPASQGTTIPPGLPLSLVNEKACACPRRRKLFRILGVKDCDVLNVIERIIDYHDKLSEADACSIIAQLRYLYKVRAHLRPSDTEALVVVCCDGDDLKSGTDVYADTSKCGKLRQFFHGYNDAHFLDNDYFEGFDDIETALFANWLGETVGIAFAPRFIATDSTWLHEDFQWLLKHKSDQVLAVLHKHWDLYANDLTDTARNTLKGCKFMCKSGSRVSLSKTYIPMPALVEKVREFGNVEGCNFLVLPSGNPKDWEFLSRLGVGLSEGLDFYLWIVNQEGFVKHTDTQKSKSLYLEIQSRAYSPTQKEKVRKAFKNSQIKLPSGDCAYLRRCVWCAPKGFLSKPSLLQVYGRELYRLFRRILEVPNATSDEAQEHLERLKANMSTTMADVADVYVYLKNYCADTFVVNQKAAIIAVPSLFNRGLNWQTPSQCVWDDDEFSKNGLTLVTKIAIRHTIEQHAPTAKSFFTDILKLPNAGIGELLNDLWMMQKGKCDDPKRVYLLYERIESCRRRCSQRIINTFAKVPLIFLRGVNSQSSQWVALEDCIWTRSVLRNKYALMPSLNQYRDLFRDTLQVPNASMEMLVTEYLKLQSEHDEDGFRYAKELLLEVARLQQNGNESRQLDGKECWPCRSVLFPRIFCSMGKFYVNDRQALFDIFSRTHTFLDMDFDTSRRITDMLRSRGCNSFLSEKVSVETDAYGPFEYDHELTRDLRGRALALVKTFEHAKCKSPYELRPLLENVDIRTSKDIRTHYRLDGYAVTKNEGGSGVKLIAKDHQIVKLEIYFSADEDARNIALATDFPEQLIAALKLEPANRLDIRPLLQVPVASLKALLIRKGIISGNEYEDTLIARSVDTDSQRQTSGSRNDSNEDTPTVSDRGTHFGAVESTFSAARQASPSPLAARTAARPHLQPRSSSRPVTPESRSRDPLTVSSNESPNEHPVTPPFVVSGQYSRDNRSRNRERLQDFARNTDQELVIQPQRSSGRSGSNGGAFDMSVMRETLRAAERPLASTPIQVSLNTVRRVGPLPSRNEEERARDFEVGFLGEQFVYSLLHDALELPGFTGEDNWTSSLRSRAGFSSFGREVSDFTYKDTQGALTRHFLQMQHPYTTPEWLSTACDNSNVPLYRLEVKTTTSQDPTTTFYMSGNQYELAKRLRVTSATPSEVYVVLRVSGLDALEDSATHRPQWRVYLDPYTRGNEGVLNFAAPTYTVTANA